MKKNQKGTYCDEQSNYKFTVKLVTVPENRKIVWVVAI